MYSGAVEMLERIRERAMRQAGHEGLMCMGQPFFPVADAQAHGPLATLYFINAMSALDGALDAYIRSTYPGSAKSRLDSLAKRISFLEKQSALRNPSAMHSYKAARNDYAHEVGKYANWNDLFKVLDAVDLELRHLGIRS